VSLTLGFQRDGDGMLRAMHSLLDSTVDPM
jgi:hypothetical protein